MLAAVLISVIMAVTLIPVSQFGVLAKTTSSQSESTAKKKNGWVKKKGYYYYYVDGKKTVGSKTIGKHKYSFDKKGRMRKGWFKINKKFYYFSRKTGKMAVNTKVDGVKLDKNGRAKKAGNKSYNKYKIETMIRARYFVERLTKPTDSSSQKRRKCFEYFMSGSRVPYDSSLGSLGSVRGSSKKWSQKFANEIFVKHRGDCVAMACAFAYMAHECGYEKVYICDDGEHGWTEISGKVYDPLFARTPSKRARSSYYKISYGEYGLSAVHRKSVKK